MTHRSLFCFGLGYSALTLARKLQKEGWSVSGTCRDKEKARQLEQQGIKTFVFDATLNLLPSAAMLEGATHILHSIPPGERGDEVLHYYADAIAHLPSLQWFGYFSTTGVYGDYGGAWVDETSALRPENERQRRRVKTEEGWLLLAKTLKVPVHVFRLAGIYGPGRNAVEDVLAGEARRIVKEGQVFSRIHVEDIALVLGASMQHPTPGEIYNVCDSLPASSVEVTEYACKLSGVPLPPEEAFETAELSEMARSFYRSNRRVSNAKIINQLGVKLLYPDYKTGLSVLWKEMKVELSGT